MHSEVAGSCPRCGLASGALVDGACPRCVLRAAVSASTRDTRLPREWGRYTLRDVCGEGGMGVVYRAYDATADRIVALKMLHARDLATDDDVERF